MIKVSELIPALVVLITVPSIGQWITIPIGSTTIWWIVYALFLYSFLRYKKKVANNFPKYPQPIKLFLVWTVLSAIYGIFMADYYWDFKLLVNNLMTYLMGISYVYLCRPENISKISRSWTLFAIIAFWLFLPFMQLEAPGKFFFPFAFLLLFWPFYSNKWKFVILFFSFAIFIYGSLGARSTALRFGFTFLLSLSFLFINHISIKFIKWNTYILSMIPIVFLTLGITGVFNVWNIESYLGDSEVLVSDAYNDSSNNTKQENLKTDTRTFIYYETITSAIESNYVIQGHSLARGYLSPFFSWMCDEQFKGTAYHKGERQSSEVSILNIFTYMGLIGVLLYAFIFGAAIRNVFSKSKNKCMYIIALYVSFRWLFAWIEDFTRFDLNNIYLWVALSMCYSPFFLNMTDKDFKLWAKNIFNKPVSNISAR